MKNKLAALRQIMVRGEAGTLLRAWLSLLWVDLGLRWLPFPRLQRWAQYAPGKTGREDRTRGRRLAGLVSTAARHHLYPMTCLRRSLVLQRMLRQEGFAAELCIGVRKEDGGLQAHAWVEVDGEPVGESERVTEAYQQMLQAGRAG